MKGLTPPLARSGTRILDFGCKKESDFRSKAGIFSCRRPLFTQEALENVGLPQKAHNPYVLSGSHCLALIPFQTNLKHFAHQLLRHKLLVSHGIHQPIPLWSTWPIYRQNAPAKAPNRDIEATPSDALDSNAL